jgi:hypothetical protein
MRVRSGLVLSPGVSKMQRRKPRTFQPEELLWILCFGFVSGHDFSRVAQHKERNSSHAQTSVLNCTTLSLAFATVCIKMPHKCHLRAENSRNDKTVELRPNGGKVPR